jgi:signal transduction histidine kinase
LVSLCDDLVGLTGCFMEYVALSDGVYAATQTTFRLREFLEQLQERHAPRIADRRLSYAWTGPYPETQVCAHAELWGRVLDEFVDNALKFTPPGGRIDVDARLRSETCVIDVSDTGPGIPAELSATLFQPFQSMAPAGTPECARGYGLGLALCRRLADRLAGTVQVASTGWSGTTVRAEFPCRLP